MMHMIMDKFHTWKKASVTCSLVEGPLAWDGPAIVNRLVWGPRNALIFRMSEGRRPVN